MEENRSGIINNLSPFGRYLKMKLIELNKTQAWVCSQLNIAPNALSQLVRGERENPDRVELIKDFLESYSETRKIG